LGRADTQVLTLLRLAIQVTQECLAIQEPMALLVIQEQLVHQDILATQVHKNTGPQLRAHFFNNTDKSNCIQGGM
jgi:hypothetical protein